MDSWFSLYRSWLCSLDGVVVLILMYSLIIFELEIVLWGLAFIVVSSLMRKPLCKSFESLPEAWFYCWPMFLILCALTWQDIHLKWLYETMWDSDYVLVSEMGYVSHAFMLWFFVQIVMVQPLVLMFVGYLGRVALREGRCLI